MKHFMILSLSLLLLAACVKDRIQPPAPVVVTTGDSLLYYWDFNNADSSKHNPVYTFPGLGPASFKYSSSYIDFTTGSALNLYKNSIAGSCLRVRNPSNSLTFLMPTTGYKNIVLQYAEERTSSGPNQNAVSYTIDGTNYISTALSNNAYVVDTTFTLQSFDFSSDANVNNNSKFAVKITFTSGNTGTSGNDRFDNVSLLGTKQ